MPESRISSCVGCRLRRRKCDQRRPICTACEELKIPRDLCLYRKMSLISKDAKATLGILNETNRELKHQKKTILRKISKKELEIKNHIEGKTPVLGRDQLYKTIEETNTSLNHYGSTSWLGLMATEPPLLALIVQIHAILRQGRMEYDMKKQEELINSKDQTKNLLDYSFSSQESDAQIQILRVTQGAPLFTQMGMEFKDNLGIIHGILRSLEKVLHDFSILKRIMAQYKAYNSLKATGTFAVDYQSLDNAIQTFIAEDPVIPNKTRITFEVPRHMDKISHFLLFLSIMSFMVFCQNQASQTETHIDYNGLLEYQDALYTLLHNYLADKMELEYLYKIETFQAILINGFIRNFIPRPKDLEEGGMKMTIFLNRAISLGKALNLHKDIDVHYRHLPKEMRELYKSIWYTVSTYDVLESLEIGIPPKIREPLVRYKSISSRFTETPIILNQVLNEYHDIEMMEDTYEFIKVLDDRCIKPLKELLDTMYPDLQEEILSAQNFDFDKPHLSPEFFSIGQSLSLRSYVYSTIQTFYQICFKRLRMINDTRSQLFQGIELKAWKYSLIVMLLQKEYFEAYETLATHPNGDSFLPVPTLLLSVFPFMRMSVRRSCVFMCARFTDQENGDIVKKACSFVFNHQSREQEIYKELEKTKNYQYEFNISDYADMSIDDNHELLMEKFAKLNDWRFCAFLFARVSQYYADIFHNDKYIYTFITYNFMFFFLMKISRFYLHQAFPLPGFSSNSLTSSMTQDGIERPFSKHEYEQNKSGAADNKNKNPMEFDFGELFTEAIDTSSVSFDFKKFFSDFYGHDIEYFDGRKDDFFQGPDIPSSGSRFF